MSELIKTVAELTRAESIHWLASNDPEYDWAEQSAHMSDKDLHHTIADNLYDFGEGRQAAGLTVLLDETSLLDPWPGRRCYG